MPGTRHSEGLLFDGSRGIRSLGAGGSADSPRLPASGRARRFASGPGETSSSERQRRETKPLGMTGRASV
jgi:hypothetical protein